MSTGKRSAYSNRNKASIPAPLEPDSDSDFTPGVVVIPADKIRRKRNAKTLRVHVKGHSYEENRTKRARFSKNQEPNPLSEFFGNDLNLCSESEDEDNAPIELDEIEGQSSKLKVPAKRLPPVRSTVTQGNAANKPASHAYSTESEPENEVSTKIKRQTKMTGIIDSNMSISRKKSGLDSETESSSTEPESDAEPILSNVPTKQLTSNRKYSTESDSETEPDSETEILTDNILKPRPGFPLSDNKKVQGHLFLDEAQGIAVPGAINTYLRDYQREGVKFFWKQFQESRGGLLGDDMGLGKTIQVISFLSAIMKKSGTITDKNRRRKHVSKLQDGSTWRDRKTLPAANATWPTCLIIAPSTVVHNWERELGTWGYFEVGLYNGSRKEREPVLNDFRLGRLDIVLTTFDLARRDIDILDNLPWSCVFIDEVHRVKNMSSKITTAFHQFVCSCRFGLTGTTIQNSYKEMWTILDWTNPGKLGSSRQWHGFVVKPLTMGQSTGASEEERAKALAVTLILKNKLLPNFFLRRTKDIIKNQLPEKTDQVVFCPLSPKQIQCYKNILNARPVQNLVNKDKLCPCNSTKSRKDCCYPFVTGDVFRYMSILIKLSNHLCLILPGPNDTPDQATRNRALAEVAFPDQIIPKYGTAIMQPQYCGKWSALEILLKEWRKDLTNKVLIFTKSVKLLEVLEFHLHSHGYGFLKLDGGTKQSERMPMIDKFHLDPEVFVFLISTLAGGTGLNLTGANKVVIFDPNWNPAHDLQAMDRAFRFGQTRDVSVYRLLGAGSVEELIYARQIYKQQQMAIGYDASMQTRYFEGVQGDNEKKGELFGIENIFKLHEDKLATKMAIEKANMAELDWALANMGSLKAKKENKAVREMIEADSKMNKEENNLRGLGTLLFDDAPPPTEAREQDVILKTLNAIGVTYSHMNEQILVPSRIEEQRTKMTLEKARRIKKAKQSPGGTAPEEEWPPKRKHHKPPPTPEEQLASRHQALIQLGMINSPDDVPEFARDFARQSREEQEEILAQLDEWVKVQREQSVSSSD